MSGTIDAYRCPLCPALRVTSGEMNAHVDSDHSRQELAVEVYALRARADRLEGQLAGVLGVVGWVRRERPGWSEFTTIEMADTLARCLFPDGIPPEVQAILDRLIDESEPAREESIRLYGADDHDGGPEATAGEAFGEGD